MQRVMTLLGSWLVGKAQPRGQLILVALILFVGNATRVMTAEVTTRPTQTTASGLDLKISLQKEVWFRLFTKQEIVCAVNSTALNAAVSLMWLYKNLRVNEYWNNTRNASRITEITVNKTASKIVFANVSWDQIGQYRCEAKVLKKYADVKVNVGDIPSSIKPLTCIHQAPRGFILSSAPFCTNAATYNVSFCKSGPTTGWCLKQLGWKKIDRCNITTSGNAYYLECAFRNKFSPQTFAIYAIKVERRNKFGVRTDMTYSRCVSNLKPMLSVRKVVVCRKISSLEVSWWVSGSTRPVSYKTVMYYKETGSQAIIKSITKLVFCKKDDCKVILNNLKPCTSYTICVEHHTFFSQMKKACSNVIASSHAIASVVTIKHRYNHVKDRVEFFWIDMEPDQEGPYYYNYTLEKRLNGQYSEEKGIVPYGVTTAPFKYHTQDTMCRLEVRKCTNCGCGKGYPSQYVPCGVKPQKAQPSAARIEKSRKTNAIIVTWTVLVVVLVVSLAVVLMFHYVKKKKEVNRSAKLNYVIFHGDGFSPKADDGYRQVTAECDPSPSPQQI